MPSTTRSKTPFATRRRRALARELVFLGRYARQSAAEVLQMPNSFRIMLVDETVKILERENKPLEDK